MKGLLIKDALMIRRTLTLYIAMVVILSLGNENAMMFALFYSLMLPVNLIALDERCRFDRLAPMLPLTSRACVLDKYLFSYASIALMTLVGVAVSCVKLGGLAMPPVLVTGVAITLLSHAISIPLLIRFGVERGRMLYMALVLVQAVLLGAVIGLFGEGVVTNSLAIGGVALALGVAANVVSVPVAVKMFEARTLA